MLVLTENAQKSVSRFIEEPAEELRVAVSGGGCSGMQYAMDLEDVARTDDTVLKDVTIDFVDSMEGSGFNFDNSNPNATASYGCGNSFTC